MSQIPALVALCAKHFDFSVNANPKNNSKVEGILKKWFFYAPFLNRYNESIPAKLANDFKVFDEYLDNLLTGQALHN